MPSQAPHAALPPRLERCMSLYPSRPAGVDPVREERRRNTAGDAAAAAAFGIFRVVCRLPVQVRLGCSGQGCSDPSRQRKIKLNATRNQPGPGAFQAAEALLRVRLAAETSEPVVESAQGPGQTRQDPAIQPVPMTRMEMIPLINILNILLHQVGNADPAASRVRGAAHGPADSEKGS